MTSGAGLEDLRSIGYDGTERLECIDAADAMYKAAVYRVIRICGIR